MSKCSECKHKLKKGVEWISTTDSLPELKKIKYEFRLPINGKEVEFSSSKFVLLFTKEKIVEIGFLNIVNYLGDKPEKTVWWLNGNWEKPFEYITHWTYMPDGPTD